MDFMRDITPPVSLPGAGSPAQASTPGFRRPSARVPDLSHPSVIVRGDLEGGSADGIALVTVCRPDVQLGSQRPRRPPRPGASGAAIAGTLADLGQPGTVLRRKDPRPAQGEQAEGSAVRVPEAPDRPTADAKTRLCSNSARSATDGPALDEQARPCLQAHFGPEAWTRWPHAAAPAPRRADLHNHRRPAAARPRWTAPSRAVRGLVGGRAATCWQAIASS